MGSEGRVHPPEPIDALGLQIGHLRPLPCGHIHDHESSQLLGGGVALLVHEHGPVRGPPGDEPVDRLGRHLPHARTVDVRHPHRVWGMAARTGRDHRAVGGHRVGSACGRHAVGQRGRLACSKVEEERHAELRRWLRDGRGWLGDGRRRLARHRPRSGRRIGASGPAAHPASASASASTARARERRW